MSIKWKLMSAALAALAISTSSAFAAQMQLARNGADDVAPPPACDDHGTDLLCGPIARGGDDGVDDDGVDFVIGQGGADDGFDDHGGA